MVCVGLDEVGRGPFFGSVFCGAVIWDDNKEIISFLLGECFNKG